MSSPASTCPESSSSKADSAANSSEGEDNCESEEDRDDKNTGSGSGDTCDGGKYGAVLDVEASRPSSRVSNDQNAVRLSCLTKTVQHVRDILSIDESITIPVYNLKRLPHLTDLRRW